VQQESLFPEKYRFCLNQIFFQYYKKKYIFHFSTTRLRCTCSVF